MKRKASILIVAVAIAGVGYWWANRDHSQEPERYVCAVHMIESLHPEMYRLPCTKEEAAKREAYYGKGNFPQGAYTGDPIR